MIRHVALLLLLLLLLLLFLQPSIEATCVADSTVAVGYDKVGGQRPGPAALQERSLHPFRGLALGEPLWHRAVVPAVRESEFVHGPRQRALDAGIA